VKVDENGNKVWDKTFGGSNSDEVFWILAAPGGGYVVAGGSLSGADGDKTEASQGDSDYWLVKVDENGNKVWDKRFGGTGSDYAPCVVAVPGGGYVVAGHSNSGANGDKTEASQGGFDYWLVKVDENGNKVWDKRFGGNNSDWPRTIIGVLGGGYVVAGWSESGAFGDKSQPSQGFRDFWLVKVDENGVKVWDRRFGGSDLEQAFSITAAPGGGYIVAGDSQSGVGGDKTQPSQGFTDFWVVKFTDCVGGPPVFGLQSSAGIMVCPGTAVTLSAVSDSVYTYTWQPGNVTGTSLALTPTQTTVFTVTAQSAGGCSASQTLAVQVVQPGLQTVNLAMNFGDTLTLDAGAGLAHQWLPTGETTQTIQITEPGTYFVSVDYGACGQQIRYVVDTAGISAGVSGRVYYDLNENGQFDSGEPPIANRPVFLLKPNGQWVSTTNTDSTGFYWAPWPAVGTYRVKVQPISSLSPNTQPNLQGEYTETITTVAEVRTDRDFGFKPYQDVSVFITPVDFFRPGFDYRVQVQYCNHSSIEVYSGDITVALDSILNYSGSVVFPYDALQPGECRMFEITGTVPSTAVLGTPLAGSATITPLADDQPDNNTDDFARGIGGAYDPNDKTAFIEARTSGDYALEGETIEYLVRFQNTGTDTAFTVVVRDTLDHETLDLTTIELIATSHPATFKLRGQGIASWQFDNILLPDSNTNEPLSHGFIRFRVKTQTGLGCDAVTSNRVSIYFDFNAPVITNDAITTINPTPVAAITSSGTTLSPNNPQVELTGTGTPDATGVSYLWNTGATTPDLTVTAPGTYTLTTTGIVGCSSTASFTVEQKQNTLAVSTQSTAAACAASATGSASVSVSGGTPPYAYEWSNGAAVEVATGLGAGTYSIQVTDSEGFTRTASVTVTAPPVLQASISASDASSCAAADGQVTIGASGGVAPYGFVWNTGSTDESLTNVSAGVYSVTITDANGCTLQRTAEVKCATSRTEALESGFTLSPNPTTGRFVVRFAQPTTGPVRVYDAVGKLLHTHQATHTTELPLDLSTQPTGVYVVQALGQTAKVVLTR
jgi:hypothetical protein